MTIYEAVNQPVLLRVPRNAERILDIGCGSGTLGQQIKHEITCEVTGVTYSESEAVLASKRIDQVLVRDLNSFDPSELGKFDCIICSHILEHLYQPNNLLKSASRSLTS